MDKVCSNCQKYPMCRAYSGISKIIDKEGIFNYSHIIFIAIAKECKYYKPQENN